MILRTPQEWADFLGMKIVCFATSKDKYAYYAINLQEHPFSYAWIKYLDEIIQSDQPDDFYKQVCWDLTKILAEHKYNNVFVPNQNGNVKMLVATDSTHEHHVFIMGTLKGIENAYKLPTAELSDWDKNIYVPSWENE